MAIKAAVERAGLVNNLDVIDEVIMGNVLSAGLGQAPASTAARLGGIPPTVPASSVNKVCASGMKAIILAANSIRAGQADIIVAGGMESMTRAPYLLPTGARTGGLRYGDQALMDSLRLDGLTDEASGQPMGCCGELCADEYGISREASDAYAKGTFERAIEAQQAGLLTNEIVPVKVAKGGKDVITIHSDQGPTNYNPEKMSTLRSVFKENGTVTAANASPLSDGAAALVICSEEAVARYNLPVLAKIIGWADASQEASKFTTSPSLAIPKALQMAGKAITDIDIFEINEAFSSVALANIKILDLIPSKVNIWGGAVALGHPLGASGARITGTLAAIMRNKGVKYGVASVCNGGGGASALVLERP